MRSARAQKALRSRPRKCRSHTIMARILPNVAKRTYSQLIDIAAVRCFDDPRGMTLRDLARFGLLFTASGQSANEPAVPPAFLKALLEKGRPDLQTGNQPAWFSRSTYQWD